MTAATSRLSELDPSNRSYYDINDENNKAILDGAITEVRSKYGMQILVVRENSL